MKKLHAVLRQLTGRGYEGESFSHFLYWQIWWYYTIQPIGYCWIFGKLAPIRLWFYWNIYYRIEKLFKKAYKPKWRAFKDGPYLTRYYYY